MTDPLKESRKQTLRDPLAYALLVLAFGGGGFVGREVVAKPASPPVVQGVSAERYLTDRAEILAALSRIEDKLDRAIEREVRR